MASISSDDTDVICMGTTDQFKINYSEIKDMSIGQCVTFPTFKTRGYNWAIDFYPKGFSTHENKGDYASVFLKLLEDHKGLNVTFTLGIFEEDGFHEHKVLLNHTFRNSQKYWGSSHFLKRSTLEEQYGKNGFFFVHCAIFIEDEVIRPPECSCGMLEDLSKLLNDDEMTDIKFEVDGEIISAHRVILGARSPVFKAELFGSMSETKMECIKIRDMKSEVFKALLHFVYTYSLLDDVDIDMIQHLLVAADRYALQGLITICEEILIENISLGNVWSFLICADRHNFNKLKYACLEFATERKNFPKLVLTQEYGQITHDFPFIIADLREIFSLALDL
ncbi:hypothetical protein LUZ60_012651 [Juncus effusus]|nr:hypothetical protein LUZ60_012651 [Juncus effusus]